MAKGDQADFTARVKAVINSDWLPDSTPILDGILSGCAYGWSYCYGMIQFVKAQSRRLTASGVFMDMIAFDFFGSWITRRTSETDAALSTRIGNELFRPKGTRFGLVKALTDLTGHAPAIFEPGNTLDTGGVGYLGMTVGTGLAVGGAGVVGAGGAGSLAMPFQFFLTAYRPSGGGIPGVMGAYLGTGAAYGGVGSLSNHGAGAGALEAASLSFLFGQITDAEIVEVILDVKPVATLPWIRISN